MTALKSFLLTSMLATPLAAQDVVVTSPCQDGSSTVTEADMAAYLAGTWQMSAAGTGFTTGTNMMSVTLVFDASTGTLSMTGDGMSVRLTPIGLARDLGDPAPDAPDFDASVEAMTPTGLTSLELDVLVNCPNPVRYWWELSMGGNRSFGALMFVQNDMASGFMANSAGGSRRVMMTR